MTQSPNTNSLQSKLKELAYSLGFHQVAFTHQPIHQSTQEHYLQWLNNNYHASMNYMENNIELRFHPENLFDGYQSMMILALNYYQPKQKNNLGEHLSTYAYGRDYHKTIKGKLKKIIQFLKEEGIQARGFTDSAPLLEKYFAEQAGIGWQGKNALIINKKWGSYFFLAEILMDAKLEDLGITNTELPAPASNHCGNCRRCMDACPTDAIVEDKVIDSSKCISYLTIEHQGSIEESLEKQFGSLIFGCDICQQVCPWNKKAILHGEKDFHFRYDGIQVQDILDLNESDFNHLFQGSPIRRAGFQKIKNQVQSLLKHQKNNQENRQS